MALNVVHTKVQLVNLICHYLINHIKDNQTKMLITGENLHRYKYGTISVSRQDLKTNHGEADVIIVHHLVTIASEASDDSYVKVVCNDTDVFVLLIHFYLEKTMTMNVSMESQSALKTIIYICQTALKHKHITKYLPAVGLHTLTGCDMVSYLFGFGKVTALKVSMGGHFLIGFGQQGADEDKLPSKATPLVSACY